MTLFLNLFLLAHRESGHPFWGDHQSRGGPREICSMCFIHLLESTGHGKVSKENCWASSYIPLISEVKTGESL